MTHVALSNRLRPIPSEQVAALSDLVRARGIAEAVRATGMGRSALLSVLAQNAATAGTCSLLREWWRTQSEAVSAGAGR
ncbi:MAG: hypothetical protein M3020_24230 [Myxococcota bacterium]|nr:hypothetical protein [Myxococcota bacterium]